VKRIERDEPIGVVIHKTLETTQGNSLCSYLYLRLAKTPCFSFIFYVFFFCRIGEQEGRTGSAWGGVEWQQWEGEVGKEVRG
jgi:hypothetical protein